MAETLTKEYLDEKFDRFADTVQRGLNSVREQMDQKLTAQRTDLVAVMDTKLNIMSDRIVSAIEQRLAEKTSEVVTHVDSFAALHQKLDQELTALRAKYERLEERVAQLELARA